MSSRYLLTLLSIMAITAKAHAKLEAHEWGTFTSLVGSNGLTQNGMYHEDEPLPRFVHPFGEVVNNPPPITVPPKSAPVPPPQTFPNRPCRSKICMDQDIFNHNVITQKMETPVIYFYTDQAQRVDVNVRFPQGVVTDTFPGPVQTSPTNRVKDPVLANGNTTFSVNVTPTTTNEAIPVVDASNIYSHARNVNSNVVVGGNGEVEKFIFYRGIGMFQPSLQITSHNGALNFDSGGNRVAAFLVHVSASEEARVMQVPNLFGTALPPVSAQDIAELSNHNLPPTNRILTARAAHAQLVSVLNSSGLNMDEAEAMINTWENGYLHVPGLRVLYVLPRSEVDEVLPLKITPTPERLVRVFVGRIEVMLDTQEQQLVHDVLAQKDEFDIFSLGRFAEPMLRRLLEVYSNGVHDANGVSLFNRLIQKAALGSDATAAVR